MTDARVNGRKGCDRESTRHDRKLVNTGQIDEGVDCSPGDYPTVSVSVGNGNGGTLFGLAGLGVFNDRLCQFFKKRFLGTRFIRS